MQEALLARTRAELRSYRESTLKWERELAALRQKASAAGEIEPNPDIIRARFQVEECRSAVANAQRRLADLDEEAREFARLAFRRR